VSQRWTGWASRESTGRVAAVRADRGAERVGLVLEENPFYAEAGGQVSDHGSVEGEGWRLSVDDVRKVEGRSAVFGRLEGEIPAGEVRAHSSVSAGLRHDTERHHTATHLLHAALREVLGAHVTQRGSLVSPDRLRFDFSHPQPMTAGELSSVESRVNDAIWADHPVTWEVVPRDEAMARGAMALFGEKYGEEVRVVEIPGVSLELCGGTHLRHTGEAGLFRIVKEAGVASGVRRIEAVTGRQAFRFMARAEEELEELGNLLRVSKDNLRRRTEQLLEERRELEQLLEELRRGGGTGESVVAEAVIEGHGGDRLDYRAVRMPVRDADDARARGDAFREENAAGVLVIAAEGPEEKVALFVFVTDDLVGSGIRAGDLVRDIAALAGGRGGGRPHMAQGGVEDPARVQDALEAGAGILARIAGGSIVNGAGA
jgi:alanyl-tRNA synthetase